MNTTILSGIVGSTAYGLATPDSDIDVLSVHLAPTSLFLGIHGLPSSAETVVTAKPDSTSHELGKYCRLAIQCNPTALEAMWLNDYTVITPIGQELVSLRTSFLSEKRVKDAYCGYAMQQAKRLVQRSAEGKAGFGSVPASRINKHGRHCMRLLLQARFLLATGTLKVLLTDAEVATARDAGRQAEEKPEDFLRAVTALVNKTQNAKSVLPEHPDTEGLNNWLVRVRRREILAVS